MAKRLHLKRRFNFGRFYNHREVNFTNFLPPRPNANAPSKLEKIERLQTIICIICQVVLILLLGITALLTLSEDRQLQLSNISIYYNNTNFHHFIFTKDALLKVIHTEIGNALEVYSADKIGIPDFGAYVIATPNTLPYKIGKTRTFMGIIHFEKKSDPQLLLKPGTLPGQCFAFKGTEGRIRIELSHKILITNVTMEHVPKILVKDTRSAPKRFQVIGLQKKEDAQGKILASFEYNIHGKSLQTFNITKTQKEGYKYAELLILSNYGNEHYTCVYRFRVHGIPVM